MLTLWDLSTTRMIAGKTHYQFPILKLTKGTLSSPVILTYLWDQKLHLSYPNQNCLPVLIFDPQSDLECLKDMGL